MAKPTFTKIKGQADNIAYQVNDALDTLATAIGNNLPKDGSEPMTGDLDMNSNDINNIYNMRFTTGGNIINVKSINGVDVSDAGSILSNTSGLPYRTQLTLTREFTVGDDYGCIVPERYVIDTGGSLVIEGTGVFMVVDGNVTTSS